MVANQISHPMLLQGQASSDALIERFRRVLVMATVLEVGGRVQSTKEGIVHILAETLADRSRLLARLEAPPPVGRAIARADEAPAPRLPKSRDFH